MRDFLYLERPSYFSFQGVSHACMLMNAIP